MKKVALALALSLCTLSPVQAQQAMTATEVTTPITAKEHTKQIILLPLLLLLAFAAAHS